MTGDTLLETATTATTSGKDGQRVGYLSAESEFKASYSEIAKTIRAQSRSLRNRLKSIHADALFAREAAETLCLPVFTNSRAGDWYFDPAWKGYEGKCYFKSTDGHYGNYGFSRRRLGLGVLRKLREDRKQTVMILDSTRRGKRFPDSFTKTVPIWISVFNQYYFGTDAPPVTLHPHIPPQESSRISQLIPEFLTSLKGLGIDGELEQYRPPKPLRAIWANRDTDFESLRGGLEEESENWCTIVLLMVSEVTSGEGIEGEYIQGAGDDAEHWTDESKLSPEIFWKHYDRLMEACNEEDGLEKLLSNLQIATPEASLVNFVQIHPPAEVYRATGTPSSIPDNMKTIINCTGSPLTNIPSSTIVYDLALETGKKGAKQLRTVLPQLKTFLSSSQRWNNPILLLAPVQDPNGAHLAVLVFILTWFFEDEGNPRAEDMLEKLCVNKATVAKRVAWVSLKEETGISRANLVSVNSALMNWM